MKLRVATSEWSLTVDTEALPTPRTVSLEEAIKKLVAVGESEPMMRNALNRILLKIDALFPAVSAHEVLEIRSLVTINADAVPTPKSVASLLERILAHLKSPTESPASVSNEAANKGGTTA